MSKQNRTHRQKNRQRQHKAVIIPPYAREELERMWERAGIENDYIFSVVMQDAEIFLQLMQRILPEKHLTRVVRHERQRTEYAAPDAKSVRYDVYSDIDGIQFVVEMQLRNAPGLLRRTRYYQGMLDIQNLRPGKDYQTLPDTFVIMICPFDLFGKGRHQYRFRNIDIDDRSLELGDGADKIFLNTQGTADDIGQDLKNFLEMVNGEKPADSYCRKVAESVDMAKRSVEVKRMFMNVNLKQMEERYYDRKEARAEGLAEGLAEGRAQEQENSLRMLCNLVANGNLSIHIAAESAAVYGVTDEADLRERAQRMGIDL